MSVSGSTSASGVPGSIPFASTMIPVWSVPSSTSSSARIIPSLSSPAHLALLELQAVRQHRARKRHTDGRAGAEVPRAADDLARVALPHVDLAQLQPVRVRMLDRVEHASDAEEAEVAVDVGDADGLDPVDLAGRDHEPVARARGPASRAGRSPAAS